MNMNSIYLFGAGNESIPIFNHLLLMSHLIFQILDNCRFEVTNTIDFKSFSFSFYFCGYFIEFLLTPLDFRFPLEHVLCEYLNGKTINFIKSPLQPLFRIDLLCRCDRPIPFESYFHVVLSVEVEHVPNFGKPTPKDTMKNRV